MMKRLFIFLFILCSLSAFSQPVTQYLGTPSTSVLTRGGHRFGTLYLPGTTATPDSAGAIRFYSGKPQVWTGLAWQDIGGVSQATLNDSTAVLRSLIASGGGSSLPSMTGNSGKYLTTDGSTASWGTVTAGATSTTALTDVSDATPTDNSALVYNQDSAKYVPKPVAKFKWTDLKHGDLVKAEIVDGDTTFVNFTPTYGTGSADSISVTGTTDKAKFEFRPSDTALLVTYGGTTFSFKQGGGTSTPTGGTTAAKIYEFDGTTNTSITPANNGDFDFGLSSTFTVGLWCKVPASGAAGRSLRAGTSNGTSFGWDFDIGEDAGHAVGALYLRSPSNSAYRGASTGAYGVLGEMQYYVFTYDGTNVNAYLNGSVISANASGGTLTEMSTGNTFRIGEFANILTATGIQINDLFVANIALSAGQVTSLYNTGAPDPTAQSWYAANCVAFWKFNNNLNDEKGTHHGTATSPNYADE